MSDLENAIRRVQKFFFDEEVPFGLALCRICLPLVLMGMVFPRWPVCRELYSADGATGQLSVGFGYIDMLPEFSGTVVAALYAVLMFAMVTLSIGFCSRISALIVCVLMTYFSMLDCVSTMTKYTAIVTHLTFILFLSEAGSIWSVDAWLANRKRNIDPTQPRFTYPKSAAWPRRLMQFFIAAVYFGAGITKIHTPSFFTGDQLQYWMLTNLNYQHRLGELLSGYPIAGRLRLHCRCLGTGLCLLFMEKLVAIHHVACGRSVSLYDDVDAGIAHVPNGLLLHLHVFH